uniref:Uncharacterized protein n=1 Tax=Chromera velia CCMP2878 TaxID=1169474 RepID=A0A0G4GZB2_9ALVE|eukprot:Cvel_24016.t1-p1 / transcript=Cvel_24016.t1 / gene=Cvel_24016 / organism=Chromera_velia_CCMP2878 / gene_product=hypothetical protein / transcript_product=hypothetical protein / location=Cvel_scaffold2548:1217-1867(-) / protein_length=217 / sequence_SO=supercontig / SO=protein_coding / is_pseudo=false
MAVSRYLWMLVAALFTGCCVADDTPSPSAEEIESAKAAAEEAVKRIQSMTEAEAAEFNLQIAGVYRDSLTGVLEALQGARNNNATAVNEAITKFGNKQRELQALRPNGWFTTDIPKDWGEVAELHGGLVVDFKTHLDMTPEQLGSITHTAADLDAWAAFVETDDEMFESGCYDEDAEIVEIAEKPSSDHPWTNCCKVTCKNMKPHTIPATPVVHEEL